MVVVFDKYTDSTETLLEMLKCMEAEAEIVILRDNGFLPEDVRSLYEYFVYGQNQEALEERELFCNFLEVPEFWEIRSGDMTHGGIYDMGCKKGDIYFANPYEKKNVQRVEWCMENGWVYKIDYYNKYALKYASEFRDIDGNVESKVYYSAQNHEVIVEQPVNGTVTLLAEGKVKALFASYTEFIEFYMEEAGLLGKSILFVQDSEDCRLLDLKSCDKSMWTHVLFSNKELLDQYVDAGGKNGSRFYAIPKEYPMNHARGEALVLTSVDWLEGIDNLIQGLPEITFHIAASTQVSDKLRRLEEHGNVKVYPQISKSDLDVLWEQCDFYLDINHYWETYNAVDVAYQKNLMIFGFENTLHHRELMVEECIFSPSDVKTMILAMKQLINNPEEIQKWLIKQQEKKCEIWEILRWF